MSNWTVQTLYTVITFIKNSVPVVSAISTILDLIVQMLKAVNDMTTDLLLCSPGIMSRPGQMFRCWNISQTINKNKFCSITKKSRQIIKLKILIIGHGILHFSYKAHN